MMAQSLDFNPNWKVVLLAGGVGGAKLAAGLTQCLSAEQLTIVVNTGDDFQHLGLTICPDLDTVMYTLAGEANPETGWGRVGESWRTITEVSRLGGAGWFKLGDLDLATHLTRAQLLHEGVSLTAVTQHLCQHLNIQHPILPMSNQLAPTFIETDSQVLPFQIWFVKERWQPRVKSVILPEDARATPQVAQAFEEADVVLVAPSNPFVSINPILNCYPVREMVLDLPKAVVAVSPIVGGNAVKGPLAKMMQEWGMPVSVTAVADYYGDLLDGLVYDKQDAGIMDDHLLGAYYTNTIMSDPASREQVARKLLSFTAQLLHS
jgi:LPPG:FO 2-phospho-L-lactate transferase